MIWIYLTMYSWHVGSISCSLIHEPTPAYVFPFGWIFRVRLWDVTICQAIIDSTFVYMHVDKNDLDVSQRDWTNFFRQFFYRFCWIIESSWAWKNGSIDTLFIQVRQQLLGNSSSIVDCQITTERNVQLCWSKSTSWNTWFHFIGFFNEE